MIWEANLTFATLLGIPRGSLIKQPLSRFIYPEDRGRYLSCREQYFAGGAPLSCEIRMRHPSTGIIWTRLEASLAKETDGARMCHIALIDITEHKQAEEKLRKSEDRHRMHAHYAIDNIWTMGIDRTFTYVSPSIERLVGFTPVEYLALSLEARLTADSLAIARKYLDDTQAAIQAGIPAEDFRGELELKRKDGSTVWTEILATCICDGEGRIVELFGITRDISVRKQMEEKLRISEEQYRLLAENISDVIWILDLDSGSFRYISPSVERLRGYTVEEALAQNLRQTITQDSQGALQSKLPERVQAYREGCHHVYTDELEHSCKNGSTVWAETATRFVLNETNGRLEVYGVSRNISERRRYEAEREKLQVQTHQLQKAESLNRMAGAIAHHFNNQLGGGHAGPRFGHAGSGRWHPANEP